MKDQNDLDKYLDNLITKSEKDIVKIYAESLKNIRIEMATLYEKYSVDGVLNLADMSKFSRLNKLMDSITEQLVTTYKSSYKLTQTTMEEQFLENYFRTAYLLEFETQQKLGFGSLNPAVIEASMVNPIAGLTLSETLEKNRNAVIFKARQEITQGLVNGESYAKMAKRMRGLFEGDASKAIRVARTEAHRVQNEARLKSIEQAEKYTDAIERVWDSSLDSGTRETHRKLDGQVADKDGYFKVGKYKGKAPGHFGAPEMDIHCRCAVRAQIKGKQPSVRRVRLEDGGTKVIPWTNYKDWQESRIGEYVKK